MATKPDPGSLKDGLRAVWRQRAVTAVAAAPAKPPASPVSPPDEADGKTLFRSAVSGTQPIADANRVILAKPPSRRIAPARTIDETSRTRHAVAHDALPAGWQDDTGRQRLPDDPEQAAFQLAMYGVAPLPDKNLAELNKPAPRPAAQQSLADRQAVMHESLHAPITLQDRLEGGDEPAYLRDGLAQTILRDLRRGRWVIQDEVDLHGLNRDQARQLVAGFLHTCLHQGKRCVRIVHGKGHGSPHKLSILRQLVRGWLAQRSEVLAYCQAKPQDGGEGALLVLLRAPRNNNGAA